MSSFTQLFTLPNELIINIIQFLNISELYQLNYLLNGYFEDIIKLMPNRMFISLFIKSYNNIPKTLNIYYAVLLNEDNEEILNWIDTIDNKPFDYTDNIKIKMFFGATYGFLDVYNKYETFLDPDNYLDGKDLFNLATKGDNIQIIIDVYHKIKFYDNNEEFGPFYTIIEKGLNNLIDNNSYINTGILVNLLFGDEYEGFMFTAMSYALKHNKVDVVSHLITDHYFDNEPGLSYDVEIILSDISKLMDVADALNVFLIQMNNYDITIYQEDLEDCIINSLIYGRFNTMMVLINYGVIINHKCFIASILGGNLECIDYIINNYDISNNIIEMMFNVNAANGTKQIGQYLFEKFPQYINDNNIINKMLYNALGNGNKECCIYAKELGANKFNKALENALLIIDKRKKVIKRIFFPDDFSDFLSKLYSFPENFDSKFEECTQLVKSWIN
jgi:hypothetical protein